jgi:hypothetical protein
MARLDLVRKSRLLIEFELFIFAFLGRGIDNQFAVTS